VTACSVAVGYQHCGGPCLMEAARSSETLVSYHNTTWHHGPEELNWNVFPVPTRFTLKMEAARPSEMLVSYHITP